MDRRKFLSLIPIGVTAAVVAPKLLIPKEKECFWGPQIEQALKNRLATIRNNYIVGCDPAVPNRVYIMYTGKKGMDDFNSALHEYYKNMNLPEFLNHISR